MLSSFRIRVGKITTNTICNYRTDFDTKMVNEFKKMTKKLASKNHQPNRAPKLLQKGLLPSAYLNEGITKRLTALNKIYMEHITLMLNNRSYGRQFEDLGIEISKVSLASGLNFMNIFWIQTKDGIPESVINKVLTGALNELQQEMGTVRFTSKIPLLRFVKDLRLEREINLDKIFDAADFGKDFESIHAKKVFTNDFVPELGKPPKMRQNVLGLDHAKIKGRIIADTIKFKTINTEQPPKELGVTETKPEHPHKLIQFTKNDFFKFYKRNRILALKMRKKNQQANYSIDKEYVETYECAEEEEEEDLDKFKDLDLEDYDYEEVDRREEDEDMEIYEEEEGEEDRSQFQR